MLGNLLNAERNNVIGEMQPAQTSSSSPMSCDLRFGTKSLLTAAPLPTFSFPLPQRFLKDSAAHHIATRQIWTFCSSSLVLEVGEICDRGSGEGRNSIGVIKNCPRYYFLCCLGGVRDTGHFQ